MKRTEFEIAQAVKKLEKFIIAGKCAGTSVHPVCLVIDFLKWANGAGDGRDIVGNLIRNSTDTPLLATDRQIRQAMSTGREQ